MAREISDFEQQALNIIKPLRAAKWQADFPWHRLERSIANMGADYGGLELIPDFQRGHVWTQAQQTHFIENCLRGVVPSSGLLIQFNSPTWNEDVTDSDLPPGLQCVDGLQRYTAVTEFVKGNVKPFGFTAEELAGTQFAPARIHMKIAIHDFAYRADLLEHYLSINAGGTPHSAEEIERVRGLLADAKRQPTPASTVPAMPAEGFFVDWDGCTRRVEAPGEGLRCYVDRKRGIVGVENSAGETIHEADLWNSIEDLERAGITVTLVE